MSYVDLSLLINVWAESCEKFIVYEHPADEKVKETHCHFLMINCKYATPEPLKRAFYDVFSTEERKGNDLWAWANKDYPNPDEGYITYMGKGSLKYKFNKGFAESTVNSLVKKWVPPDQYGKTKNSKKESEFRILLHEAEKAIKAKKLTVSMKDIACFIMSYYLRHRNPVPRRSDTNRYAFSIYAIVQELCHENLIEQVERQALIENMEF